MFSFRIEDNKRVDIIRSLRDVYQVKQADLKDKSVINKMNTQYKIDHIWNSNSIEGNSLTYWETEILLQKGMTINGKSVKEHTEAINLSIAYDYLLKLINNKGIISKSEILLTHRLITHGLLEEELNGKYRNCNVRIGRSEHIPPNHQEVSNLMDKLTNWYNKEYLKGDMKVEELAIAFKYYMVNIHPFADGNGRVSRLWLNILLMREGYTPITINSKTEERLQYYHVLETTNKSKNLSDLIEFMYIRVEESLIDYIDLLS